MNHVLTARDVMTKHADTVQDSATLHEAIELLVTLELSALPVVDKDQHCVGFVTKTDIVRSTGELDQENKGTKHNLAALFFDVGLDEVTNQKVSEIMTQHVLSVAESDSIYDVAERMLLHQVHHVPVCDAENRVVGVVSSMDLIKTIRRPPASTS